MLKIENLHAWYGGSHILQGVNLEVGAGELVCLVGRNGAGKTTTVKSVAGLIPKTRGTVRFEGKDILGLPAHARYAMGLAYVPEERRIVPGLTVRENIQLGLMQSLLHRREKEIIDEIAETFPRLKERLDQQAVTMSGGEQQMLAIARATASRPKFIMLDEPSEGIMPVLVDEMFRYFESLKASGVTILLIEQNVELALKIADRAYILDQGEIVHTDTARSMLADEAMQERYCSV
ncbi:ABC transporter ATP-binding protein [Bordetella petrii]|uniref:Branched-chain amino acid ABC transporter, ATP-binding protein n=1 Tax=Bordetella petrii (strain ATCC BAA-461 / DSM 12804 / CCUG 43448 / CIP 107267 / Se-1111R) TaxID=340100 RepID=A9IC47_BORPD|nr:ABC transporter ATP-binding protein [Bordetella petrii]CAP41522.1 putative branched-chain amino acid ABC transporter, ATP-binding protein [Bordetella petrii]